MLKRIWLLSGLFLFTHQTIADELLPFYPQFKGISGNISVVGSDTLATLVSQWGRLFTSFYPKINVQIQTSGSSTAVPALIEGTAQFGTMSRPMTRREIGLFEQRYAYPPTAIKVAIDAMAIFVHQDNPISSLSLSQLDALYSQTLYCGATARLERWGQLGLTGAWEKRHIQLLGRNSVSGTYGLFKSKALCEGDFRAKVNELLGSGSVVQSVRSSLNAIGYAGLAYRTAGVKMLPLLVEGVPVVATPESVISGRYPLSRYLYIYVNKPKNKSLSPKEAEFIKFILSSKGQSLVASEGFVPLPKKMIKAQRVALGIKATRRSS